MLCIDNEHATAVVVQLPKRAIALQDRALPIDGAACLDLQAAHHLLHPFRQSVVQALDVLKELVVARMIENLLRDRLFDNDRAGSVLLLIEFGIMLALQSQKSARDTGDQPSTAT